MFPSFIQIMLVLLLVLILFGAGKLPKVMGDLGRGIRSFKGGMQGEDDTSGQISKKDKDEEK